MKRITLLLLFSISLHAQDQPPAKLTPEELRAKIAAMKGKANAIGEQGRASEPPAPPPQAATPQTKKPKDKTLIGKAKSAVTSTGKKLKKL